MQLIFLSADLQQPNMQDMQEVSKTRSWFLAVLFSILAVLFFILVLGCIAAEATPGIIIFCILTVVCRFARNYYLKDVPA